MYRTINITSYERLRAPAPSKNDGAATRRRAADYRAANKERPDRPQTAMRFVSNVAYVHSSRCLSPPQYAAPNAAGVAGDGGAAQKSRRRHGTRLLLGRDAARALMRRRAAIRTVTRRGDDAVFGSAQAAA